MRHAIEIFLAGSLFFASSPVTGVAQNTLPRQHTPRSTSAAITPGDLMTRLYIFADDSMLGREVGTIGNVTGTDYIAAEARRIGLTPAGDDGSYFQTVPYKTRTLDTASVLSVGGSRLALVEDYLPLGRDAVNVDDLPIVYGGVIGDTAAALPAEQAQGKLVVLTLPPGGNIMAMQAAPSAEGAAALAIVALDQLPPMIRGYVIAPQGFIDDPDAPQAGGGQTFLLVSEAAAAKMFTSPLDQLHVGDSGVSAAMHLRWDVQPTPYPSSNVVAVIPGSDPELQGEYVALGAHTDHVGFSHQPVAADSIRIWNQIVRPEGADDAANQATPAQQAQVDSMLVAYRAAHPGSARLDSISNGADDDGSGSVALLEIAQRMMSLDPKPRRSILFVWHMGEEKGLIGSGYFTDHPTVPRDSIVAQLNMDMIGRGRAEDETGRTKDGTPVHGGPNYLMLVGSRRLSTELGDLVETVNTDDHHDLRLDYALDADGHPSNIYCRSDHYEYARYGIPVVFFTTGLHRDYHQVTDEPEYIDYAHFAKIVSFIDDVAEHVADLDHRVVVDQPKPDPHGTCRQ